MQSYCEQCHNNHFLISNDENGNDDLQKCDECNHFKSDDEARAFVLKIIIEKKGKQ
jgi:hypothetical protein|tara:strand:+ start:85 stop:252 length:168 start_codon:yes stop_codon:yes gene_type:complete